MKQMLGDFIYTLRKEKGYSQAELGDLVGVSNKAVSKWETDEANPELSLIPRLSEVLGVTADELLRCQRNENNNGEANEVKSQEDSGLFIKVSKFEYISKKRTKKGTPYVHINLSLKSGGKANGVLAIGLNAKGVIAIGLLARGIIAAGLLPIGLLSFGWFALGLIAAGGVAIGLGAAAGGVAVGFVAVGGVAIGYVAVGGLAIGYHAFTGTGGVAIGMHEYLWLNSSSNHSGFIKTK